MISSPDPARKGGLAAPLSGPIAMARSEATRRREAPESVTAIRPERICSLSLLGKGSLPKLLEPTCSHVGGDMLQVDPFEAGEGGPGERANVLLPAFEGYT